MDKKIPAYLSMRTKASAISPMTGCSEDIYRRGVPRRSGDIQLCDRGVWPLLWPSPPQPLSPRLPFRFGPGVRNVVVSANYVQGAEDARTVPSSFIARSFGRPPPVNSHPLPSPRLPDCNLSSIPTSTSITAFTISRALSAFWAAEAQRPLNCFSQAGVL
jgi:hypothetical protein